MDAHFIKMDFASCMRPVSSPWNAVYVIMNGREKESIMLKASSTFIEKKI